MSRDYWFISDTHFGHKNILKWGRSQFSSTEHMDEMMVENWNSVVKKGDLVYHLGDVFFGPKDNFKKLWPRLNGSKRLIIGNHDDVKYLSSGGFFQKTMLWRVWNDKPLLFTHVPVHPANIQERIIEKGGINVHGHTHFNGSPEGPYRSVCVELNNYTPVNLEELV
jgi:calcineurin-like phosphoesterase family protein